MNSGTRSLPATTVPGPADTSPLVRAARPADHGRVRRPELRPWPLFSGLGPLGALPTAPGMARGFTATVLGDWDMVGRGDLADSSAVVVSELATNVVDRVTAQHGDPVYLADGRMALLWLRLMSDRSALRVEIWDNLPPSAGFPVLRSPGAAGERGRGLAVVDGLSRAWGWHPVPGSQAKCTWAVLDAGQPVPVPCGR
jgi:hypothetical protein